MSHNRQFLLNQEFVASGANYMMHTRLGAGRLLILFLLDVTQSGIHFLLLQLAVRTYKGVGAFTGAGCSNFLFYTIFMVTRVSADSAVTIFEFVSGRNHFISQNLITGRANNMLQTILGAGCGIGFINLHMVSDRQYLFQKQFIASSANNMNLTFGSTGCCLDFLNLHMLQSREDFHLLKVAIRAPEAVAACIRAGSGSVLFYAVGMLAIGICDTTCRTLTILEIVTLGSNFTFYGISAIRTLGLLIAILGAGRFLGHVGHHIFMITLNHNISAHVAGLAVNCLARIGAIHYRAAGTLAAMGTIIVGSPCAAFALMNVLYIATGITSTIAVIIQAGKFNKLSAFAIDIMSAVIVGSYTSIIITFMHIVATDIAGLTIDRLTCIGAIHQFAARTFAGVSTVVVGSPCTAFALMNVLYVTTGVTCAVAIIIQAGKFNKLAAFAIDIMSAVIVGSYTSIIITFMHIVATDIAGLTIDGLTSIGAIHYRAARALTAMGTIIIRSPCAAFTNMNILPIATRITIIVAIIVHAIERHRATTVAAGSVGTIIIAMSYIIMLMLYIRDLIHRFSAGIALIVAIGILALEYYVFAAITINSVTTLFVGCDIGIKAACMILLISAGIAFAITVIIHAGNLYGLAALTLDNVLTVTIRGNTGLKTALMILLVSTIFANTVFKFVLLGRLLITTFTEFCVFFCADGYKRTTIIRVLRAVSLAFTTERTFILMRIILNLYYITIAGMGYQGTTDRAEAMLVGGAGTTAEFIATAFTLSEMAAQQFARNIRSILTVRTNCQCVYRNHANEHYQHSQHSQNTLFHRKDQPPIIFHIYVINFSSSDFIHNFLLTTPRVAPRCMSIWDYSRLSVLIQPCSVRAILPTIS